MKISNGKFFPNYGSRYTYINSNINFSLSFTSTLNSPIHQSNFLSIFHFISRQQSNSFVQIPVHFSLQLSNVQPNSPNSCLFFTTTVNSPIYLSKFLFNTHFNSQQSNSIIQTLVHFSLQPSKIKSIVAMYFKIRENKLWIFNIIFLLL